MSTMRFSASITGKGQVTIPAEIRKRLGVSTPDKIDFLIDEHDVVRLVRPRYSIRDLYGILPELPAGTTSDFETEIREAVEEGMLRKFSNVTKR